jgi:hypothetical protein
LTSPRRKQGKPIRSVKLRVRFKADRKTLLRIKRAVPEARWKRGELEVTVEGSGPAQVADAAKALSDRVRAALEGDGGADRKAKSSKRL